MSDLDGICLTKRAGKLTGADMRADEFLAGIKEGAEVMVSIRRPRSIKNHKLLFALLAKVVDNTDQWPSVEILLDEVKLATGHAEMRANAITGETYVKPKSINFAAMSQDEFRPWFNRVVELLATRALGVMPDALMAEVLAMVEPQSRRAA